MPGCAIVFAENGIAGDPSGCPVSAASSSQARRSSAREVLGHQAEALLGTLDHVLATHRDSSSVVLGALGQGRQQVCGRLQICCVRALGELFEDRL
jgi:hypothetical protein